jgi:hypothetical protein
LVEDVRYAQKVIEVLFDAGDDGFFQLGRQVINGPLSVAKREIAGNAYRGRNQDDKWRSEDSSQGDADWSF